MSESAVDPKTIAIGAAVVVAGVGAYMLLSGPRVDDLGVRGTDNPVTGVLENEADRVLDAYNEAQKQQAAGNMYTLLANAWKPWGTPDFDWEVFAKQINDIARIKKGVTLDSADEVKFANDINTAKKQIQEMVDGRTAMKLGEAIEALKSDDVQTAKAALAKVDSAVNGTLSPNWPPAVLSAQSQRLYNIAKQTIADKASQGLRGATAAASAAGTVGAGLEHLLSQNAINIMVDQYFRWTPAQQKQYVDGLTPDQKKMFMNQIRQAKMDRVNNGT
jgi:hypothetical protein